MSARTDTTRDREALAAALRASSSERSIVSRGVFDEDEEEEEQEEERDQQEQTRGGGGDEGGRRRLSMVREASGGGVEGVADVGERRQLATELLDALYLGTSNFFLAYNTRAGIAVVLRALKLLQRRWVPRVTLVRPQVLECSRVACYDAAATDAQAVRGSGGPARAAG